MWSGDPRTSRRAARYARRTERYARRDNRRAYRSPSNRLFGLLVLVVVLVFVFFTHFWMWLLFGILALFIALVAVRGGFSGLFNQRAGMPWSQRPQQAYTPYEQPPQQQPYAPYEQGHQSQETYREGDNQFYYPPSSNSNSQSYENPQAQYPQQGQMPPM